jgi:hypothetical protein
MPHPAQSSVNGSNTFTMNKDTDLQQSLLILIRIKFNLKNVLVS